MTTENIQPSSNAGPEALPPQDLESVLAPDVTPVVNTSEDSTPPEPAVPDDANAEPKRNRAQERIEDLVAERNAAKEYADYWREKALEVMQTSKPTQEPRQQPQAAQVPEVPPTLEQFGYDQNKWAEAYSKWTDAQLTAKVEQALEQSRQQTQQRDIAMQFEEKINVFKETHPDFDIVMANPRLPQLDKIAAAMIVASDHSADISYKLGKNPDLATRISRMSSSQQALAIGRLENEVIREQSAPRSAPTPSPAAPKPAAQVKPVTQAPEPLEPVPGGGAPDVSPENMDTNEWMRSRLTQVRQNRTRRYR